MATGKVEGLAVLNMLRDGIEHHKGKLGDGTREIWLGWIRVAVCGLGGSVRMKCEDCGDVSRRGPNARKCDICGGEVITID